MPAMVQHAPQQVGAASSVAIRRGEPGVALWAAVVDFAPSLHGRLDLRRNRPLPAPSRHAHKVLSKSVARLPTILNLNNDNNSSRRILQI